MKKIITLLLVVALLATCMVTSAFAAKTGDTVSVSFTVSNPGASTFGAKINYDKSALELVSIEAGKLTSGGMFTANVKTGKVAYVSTENITGSGTVFVAKFKVLAAAEAGKTYNVTASVDGANTANASGEKVSFSISGGSVKVDKVCAHKWSSWKTTKEPTCGNAGTQKRTCSLCGTSQTRSIAATGHNFDAWEQTTAPTCTEPGVETRLCACGKKETREIAATGHSFGEWKQTTAPTCTEPGIETRECACGEKETREVAATGHSLNGYGKNETHHWLRCEKCDHMGELKTHEYDQNGVCVCGAKKSAEAPAQVDNQTSVGVSYIIWIFVIILVLAGGTVAAAVIIRKRKASK